MIATPPKAWRSDVELSISASCATSAVMLDTRALYDEGA